MRKVKSSTKDEELMDVLRRLTKRVEEAMVDIHEMKSDLKYVNLRLSNVESSTKIMKVDMEKMRDEMDKMRVGIEKMRDEMGNMKGDLGRVKTDVKKVKTDLGKVVRDANDLIVNTREILVKMVAQEEHEILSGRVSSLERTAKAA